MFSKQTSSLEKSTFLLILLPIALCFSRVIVEFLVFLLLFSFFYESKKKNEWKWLKTKYMILFFTISLWLVFISFFAEVSVASSLKRSLLWIRHPLILMAIAFCFINTNREKKYFLIGVVGFLGIVIVDCYYQKFTGYSVSEMPALGQRLTSFLDRPNIGSYLLRLSLPMIALSFYLHYLNGRETKLFIYVNLFLFFGVLPVVFMTGERTSSMLLLLVLVLLFVSLLVFQKEKRIATLFLSTFFLVLLSTLVLYDPFINQRVMMLIEDVSHFSGSLYGSLFYAAYYLWQSKGIFLGVGLKNFREVCPELIDNNIVTYCDLHPHNFYLEWLSEAGFVGLCLFVLLGFFLLKNAFLICCHVVKLKTDRNLFLAAFFCFATFLTNFFPFAATMSFFSNWNAALVWFSLAIAFMVNRDLEKILIVKH